MSLVLLAIAAGGAAGSAQEAVVPRAVRLALIREKLASEDFAQIAWALHDAVEFGLAEVAADLPAVLQRCAVLPEKGERAKREARSFALAWALDAAIKFQAKLDDRELAPIAASSGLSEDAILIAAARSPAHCVETLLDLAGEFPEDVVETAACVILESAAPVRLLDHLLDAFPVELQVVAFDRDPPQPIESETRRGVG